MTGMKKTHSVPGGPRRPRERRATALQWLVIAPLFVLAGCGQREAPVVAPGSLTFKDAAPHPAGEVLSALDVAVWRQPAGVDGDRFYAAVGSEGIMVHLEDGGFLQRLAHSAASHVGVLYAMPVDEVVADFLVAVDPSRSQLTWFEINAGSGALRRLAGESADIGEAVAGLCTHSTAGTSGHRVVVVTRSGVMQDWTVVAHAGKQPNFANRIVATRDRTLTLGGAGGDCAVDPTTGAVYVVVDAREVRRVDANGTLAPQPALRSGDPRSLRGTVTSIDLVRDVRDASWLLVVDDGGRRLVASDVAGQELASVALEPSVTSLRSAGGSVAVVTDSAAMQLADWAQVAAALGLKVVAASDPHKDRGEM
jgi:myo-inositol-hexaphosphate 3-phosphohydrolase